MKLKPLKKHKTSFKMFDFLLLFTLFLLMLGSCGQKEQNEPAPQSHQTAATSEQANQNIQVIKPVQVQYLTIELINTAFDDVFQLFYDTGNNFNESESIRVEYKKQDGLQKLQIDLPDEKVRNIRLDPMLRNKATLFINSMTLHYTDKFYKWEPIGFVKEFHEEHDIKTFGLYQDLAAIQVSGADPYLVYKGNFSKVYSKMKNRTE
ncbi:MAG: 2 protein [Ignavibacteria bacterium]|nr:2 protein [Ignavibacteria bacterium]